MFGEEIVTFKVRSSELEMGLLTSDDPTKMEGDVVASVPSSSLSPLQREVRALHALKEECTLDEETLT